MFSGKLFHWPRFFKNRKNDSNDWRDFVGGENVWTDFRHLYSSSYYTKFACFAVSYAGYEIFNKSIDSLGNCFEKWSNRNLIREKETLARKILESQQQIERDELEMPLLTQIHDMLVRKNLICHQEKETLARKVLEEQEYLHFLSIELMKPGIQRVDLQLLVRKFGRNAFNFFTLAR
jgi:hypothetical protein